MTTETVTRRDKAAAVLAAFTGDVWCLKCQTYKDKTDVTCIITLPDICGDNYRLTVCHDCFNVYCCELRDARQIKERQKAMETRSYRVALQARRTKEKRERTQARQAKRRRERGRHQ